MPESPSLEALALLFLQPAFLTLTGNSHVLLGAIGNVGGK